MYSHSFISRLFSEMSGLHFAFVETATNHRSRTVVLHSVAYFRPHDKMSVTFFSVI